MGRPEGRPMCERELVSDNDNIWYCVEYLTADSYRERLQSRRAYSHFMAATSLMNAGQLGHIPVRPACATPNFA
ncbi:uncharacterized protein METZ01_LOCUS187794, partial [marine metagenome]